MFTCESVIANCIHKIYKTNKIEYYIQYHFDGNVKLPILTENLTNIYFDPRCKENIFPSLFLGLIQNSAKSFMLVGKNGSEPTIGSEDIAGGNLRPLSLTLRRR